MTNIHPRLASQPSSALALTTLISDARADTRRQFGLKHDLKPTVGQVKVAITQCTRGGISKAEATRSVKKIMVFLILKLNDQDC